MRSAEAFAKCKAEGRAALVGYLPAGYPTLADSIKAIDTMIENGADLIEVGLPYSDPVMDGPAIQKAADLALREGFRTKQVFEVVKAVSGRVPILVMTYWNLIERYGVDAFARDFKAAGGAGLITPDLIPDEADEWIAASDEHGLDRVFLVAPSSTEERIIATVAQCRGFVYAQSVMGVTGARSATSAAAPGLVERTRAHTDLPIGVGLGVRSGDQAAEIAAYGDAVIVGSAIVNCYLDAPDIPTGHQRLAELTADLAAGVRR
ncbi:tryptophan synthase subunit alpha [Glycomyces buryatensis]|uniref:Tryptophan synthase alpha chain n=1 Tax=Glycomyces buryatensis TaxID=2570927 RepID=A0A4S8PTG1_9ACTN|nr:tryptophan synthase subunit alpha [Glycomyces buryatensis]THV34638.1 tryptophan synthase subunit alpha [Glycomyces buryatensis]